MISKCPKCNNTFFELEENSPSGSNYKLLFVQCSSCGSVLGVMDFFNIGTKISIVEEMIEKLDKKINNIDNNIVTVANLIKRH